MTREEAVARIKDHIETHRYNERNAVKIFEALDMAIKALEQPEQNYDEWCMDCKEYDKEKHSCPRWNRVIRQTLQDAQSEPCEDAVQWEQLERYADWFCADVSYPEFVREAKAFIKSVTPKQRIGYWYPVGMVEAVGGESAQWGSAIAYHRCSECDEQALRDDFEQEVLSEFCPHCGAMMEKWSDD